MPTFNELNIPEILIQKLNEKKITTPTAVQEQAIVPIQNRENNLIVCAPPGTGKTLTFLLPLLQAIDTNGNNPQVMILVPTHELAMQITKVAAELAPLMNVRLLPLIGKVNMMRQIDDLKKIKPHLIVGSTGRILELAEKKKIKLHEVKTIIVDEADRLLCKEAIDPLLQLLKRLQRDKQLLLFSASVTKETQHLAQRLSPKFQTIHVTDTPQLSPTIENMYYLAEEFRDKFRALRSYLAAERPHKTIIFVNQSAENENVFEKLAHHQFKVANICGQNNKTERAKALQQFRSGAINVLIASDIAARGLDVADISHVIHLDIPKNALVYLHRAGRTGRANQAGKSILIATQKEKSLLQRLEKNLNISMTPFDIRFGKIIPLTEKQNTKQLHSEEHSSIS